MDERAGNLVCAFVLTLELCTELLKLIRAGKKQPNSKA
jgi:hypothetical protein